MVIHEEWYTGYRLVDGRDSEEPSAAGDNIWE
jgi:hypothetical protein